MRLFFLLKLPMAYLAGLRILEISETRASVSVPFKFLTKNPFQSIYFAVLSMAAELSTGILAMAALRELEKPLSMLIVGLDAKFIKKAKTKVIFTCNQGKEIYETVFKSLEEESGSTINVLSEGFDINGKKVAEFYFNWSFKKKPE